MSSSSGVDEADQAICTAQDQRAGPGQSAASRSQIQRTTHRICAGTICGPSARELRVRKRKAWKTPGGDWARTSASLTLK